MVLNDRLWHPNDVFKQYPQVDKIFFFHALGVDPEYRKRGIARNLVLHGIKVGNWNWKKIRFDLLLFILIFQLAESLECQFLSVMATSPHTRRIFGQLDFQTLRYIDSDNFLDDTKNGRVPIFPNVDTSVHVKLCFEKNASKWKQQPPDGASCNLLPVFSD